MEDSREVNTSPVYVGTAEKLELEPHKGAQIHVHFRRHDDWVDHMYGEIGKVDDKTLRYGFDWLGDDEYDFGKSDDKIAAWKVYHSRYDYIEKIQNDPDQANPGKIETVQPDIHESEVIHKGKLDMAAYQAYQAGKGITVIFSDIQTKTEQGRVSSYHSSHNGTDSLKTRTTAKMTTKTVVKSGKKERIDERTSEVTIEEYTKYTGVGFDGETNNRILCISDLCNEYTHPNLRSVHGYKYFSSFLNIRYNHQIKLKLGYRDFHEKIKFGDNDDKIVFKYPEGAFKIEPQSISIGDFENREVEITLINTSPLTSETSIYACHIDKNTPVDRNGEPLGDIVGQMVVMPNEIYHKQYCYLIKVHRSAEALAQAKMKAKGTTDPKVIAAGLSDNFAPYGLIAGLLKPVQNMMSQALIETYLDTNFQIMDYPETIYSDGGSQDLVNYFKKQMKEQGQPLVEKPVFIFLLGYNNASSAAFAAPDRYPTPSSKEYYERRGKDWGNSLVVYNNVDNPLSSASTMAHELGHTLALLHSFTQGYAEAGEVVKVNVKGKETYAPGIPSVYYTRRVEDMEHMFLRGSTENLMDYPSGMIYNSKTSMTTVNTKEFKQKEKEKEKLEEEIKKGINLNMDDFRKKTANENLYYKFFPIKYTYNPHPKRVSFWKWQWKVMEQDHELKHIKEGENNQLKIKR